MWFPLTSVSVAVWFPCIEKETSYVVADRTMHLEIHEVFSFSAMQQPGSRAGPDNVLRLSDAMSKATCPFNNISTSVKDDCLANDIFMHALGVQSYTQSTTTLRSLAPKQRLQLIHNSSATSTTCMDETTPNSRNGDTYAVILALKRGAQSRSVKK